MDRRSPARITAGCFALSGFAVAVFASLGVGTTAETTLLRGIIALVACYTVGTLVGTVAERCIRDGLEEFVAKNPFLKPAPPHAETAPAPREGSTENPRARAP